MSYNEIIQTKYRALVEKENPIILSIESSCDETACAILRGGREILSSIVASQIDIHRRFGGVVPEVASRNHVVAIDNVVKEALKEANMQLKDIDCIAVTYGSGLLGALLVGVSYAKALSYALEIPLIPVSHIKGHISANYVACGELEPPYICLLVSGGNTAILRVDDYNSFKLLGETQDDAVGEAFDKVARVLGLCYPGGPEIEKLAKDGAPNIDLPRPYKNEEHLNFSFSGIKTAVINYIHNNTAKGVAINAADVACSFQELATDVLCDNVIKAANRENLSKIVVAGGVGANACLRAKLDIRCKHKGIKVYYPPIKLCTDNAVMIASCAYFLLKSGVLPADLSLDAKAMVGIK